MTRTIAFDPNGWEDYVYWQTKDRKTLKHILSGAWSRRIDDAHRLVYYVTDDRFVILQAREHC